MRGYEGVGASAAVWTDNGKTHVFTGEGDVSHILDVAASAFYGISAGSSHH